MAAGRKIGPAGGEENIRGGFDSVLQPLEERATLEARGDGG